MSEKAAQVLAGELGRSTVMIGAGPILPSEVVARALVTALATAGFAIVELPEPFPIEVTEIDMEPELDEDDEHDGRARMVLRFSGAIKPGRMFDRPALAAALLAAEAVQS